MGIRILAAAVGGIVAGFGTIDDPTYGGDPTGVSDSGAAVAAMVADVGYAVFNPTGRYLITTPFSVTDQDVLLYGNDCTIIQNCDAAVFKQYVTFTNEQAISSVAADSIDMGSGTTTATTRLTVTDASVYAVDDVVKIISDDLGNWADAANNERIGEYGHVAAIDTGSNYVWLRNAVRETYTTSPRLWKMNKTYKCKIKDFNFTCTQGLASTYNQPNIWISGAYKPQLLNNTTEYSYSEFIRLDGCYKARSTSMISNLQTSSGLFRYGYGVIEYSCHMGDHQILADNVRHAYTTGVKGTTAGDDTPELFGRTFKTIVHDSIADNCQSSPFSTHADGLEIHFDNCHASFGYKGPSGGQQGFGIRGMYNKITNSSYDGPGTGISITPDYTSVTTNTNNVFIDGFVYKAHPRSIGTNIALSVTATATSIVEVRANNIRVIGATSASQLFDLTYAKMYIKGLDLTGTFSGSTGRAFELDHSTVDVEGGLMDISSSTGTNIHLANVLDASSSFTWRRGKLIVGSATFVAFANLNSANGAVSVTDLDIDTAPSTVVGYTAAGASATKKVSYRVNGGALIGGTPQRYIVLAADNTQRTRSSNNSTDTTQTSFTTVTLPGGSMSTHGYVRITILGSMTNSASSKVFYVIFGGTNYLAMTGTSVAELQNMVMIRNAGATNSQKGYAATANAFGTSSTAVVTSSVDTTADVTIDFQCKWTANVASEAINLEGFLIEVINPSV